MKRIKKYADYELMKFAIWGMIIGFAGSLVVATTMMGLDNLYWDTKKVLQLEVLVGWSMISGAGIGIVFDLLRHTWEPEFTEKSAEKSAVTPGTGTGSSKEDLRRAA